MEEEEEEILDETRMTPFRTLLHRAISFLRHQEELIEQEMLNTAIENSMDTYRETLFVVDNNRKLSLDPFILKEEKEDECHLCLENMKIGDEVIQLPCQHLFHSPCVHELVIHQHITCPLCRKSIPLEKSEEKSKC